MDEKSSKKDGEKHISSNFDQISWRRGAFWGANLNYQISNFKNPQEGLSEEYGSSTWGKSRLQQNTATLFCWLGLWSVVYMNILELVLN